MIKINDKITKISVIGGSQVGSDIYDLAYDVGREIAKRGAILICGGLTGVMEAACRGAKKEGGLTIGILPSADESNANRYVDIKLPTGFGYARNITCSGVNSRKKYISPVLTCETPKSNEEQT